MDRAGTLRDMPLDELVLDQDLNLRDAIDSAAVDRYCEGWAHLPPVVVYVVEGRPLLADGFHRHAAAVKLRKRVIPAEVRDGSMAEALDHAAGANLTHGLPLNRHERRRAVDLKVRLHPDWSDRRLAEEIGVSRDLVGKVRKSLVEGGQIAATAGRVGADGKTYPSQGLPKDPNERRPQDKQAGSEDPRDRGSRESDLAPWEVAGGDAPKRPRPGIAEMPDSFADLKAMALADPVHPATPTIDEMLQVMARQILELVQWTEAEGFEAAYRGSSPTSRNAFQKAAYRLSQRADALAVG